MAMRRATGRVFPAFEKHFFNAESATGAFFTSTVFSAETLAAFSFLPVLH
jgi:hypothetical protein